MERIIDEIISNSEQNNMQSFYSNKTNELSNSFSYNDNYYSNYTDSKQKNKIKKYDSVNNFMLSESFKYRYQAQVEKLDETSGCISIIKRKKNK